MVQRRRLILGLAAYGFSGAVASAQPAALLDSLTQADASRGIKDALGLAALNATTRLGQRDGFFAAPRVHIPLPGILGETQRRLSGFGMAGPLDDLELRLNRGAEAAMPEAAGLFTTAVRTMTLTDAIEIVRGPQDSATRYLRGRTEVRLTSLLRPPMTAALTQSGAFTLLREVARNFRMSAMATDLRTQIITFATTKALDGAFLYIADEERAIRSDPMRRTTDILRRVFG
jgi:Protein of unknown function (DUF4197)